MGSETRIQRRRKKRGENEWEDRPLKTNKKRPAATTRLLAQDYKDEDEDRNEAKRLQSTTS